MAKFSGTAVIRQEGWGFVGQYPTDWTLRTLLLEVWADIRARCTATVNEEGLGHDDECYLGLVVYDCWLCDNNAPLSYVFAESRWLDVKVRVGGKVSQVEQRGVTVSYKHSVDL